MFLVSSCSCLCPIQWGQVLSREWRCSWSSADRRCSNYIWVIDNVIACQGASYIRDLTVHAFLGTHQKYECTRAKLIATKLKCFLGNHFHYSTGPAADDGHGMTVSRCFLKSIKVIKFGTNVKIITCGYSLHCLDNIKQYLRRNSE